MIEGYIDTVDEAGLVHGWARDRGSELPCAIAIHEGEELIAEAVADEFRRDLFNDRIGHGHYGFQARILHSREIRSRLTLSETRSSILLNPDSEQIYESRQLLKRNFVRIQDVIGHRNGWEESDLLNHVSILRLEDNLRRMHPIRFLDCVYQFLLGRWSDDRARRDYAEPLRDGSLQPNDLFRAVLTSEERRTNGLPLVGPFHYRFPFDLKSTFAPAQT